MGQDEIRRNGQRQVKGGDNQTNADFRIGNVATKSVRDQQINTERHKQKRKRHMCRHEEYQKEGARWSVLHEAPREDSSTGCKNPDCISIGWVLCVTGVRPFSDQLPDSAIPARDS